MPHACLPVEHLNLERKESGHSVSKAKKSQHATNNFGRSGEGFIVECGQAPHCLVIRVSNMPQAKRFEYCLSSASKLCDGHSNSMPHRFLFDFHSVSSCLSMATTGHSLLTS